MKRSGFDAAIAIGRTLPDVEVTTTWGAPALKVRGKMFACVAINKSAEPNSMVVLMDAAQRDLLLEEDPATYYLTDHDVEYPCVLVRLSRAELRDDVVPATLRLFGAENRQRLSRLVEKLRGSLDEKASGMPRLARAQAAISSAPRPNHCGSSAPMPTPRTRAPTPEVSSPSLSRFMPHLLMS